MMASETKQMGEVPVMIEGTMVAQLGAVERIDANATLSAAVTPQNDLDERVTDELVVWDGVNGQPFHKDEHSFPQVKTNPKSDIPLKFTGHLPNLGSITNEEEQRLQDLYSRPDGESYLLQKNRHAVRGKFYIKVSDAQTLGPRQWINDTIVDFVWMQLTERYNGDQGMGTTIALFPCFFVTKLTGEGGDNSYGYKRVSSWSATVLGRNRSPLDYDVLLFPKCSAGHWWVYVVYPKVRHIECMYSMFYNDTCKTDIPCLWWWLNDDLHCHWGMESPLDLKEWTFTSQRTKRHNGLPSQTNGWDCGLYAVHVAFALAVRAPFSEITKERVNLFRRKLVLYLLDDDDTRDIMLPEYAWHERVQLQSRYFARESERLYQQNVPKCVVDVCGDGNCLYYCLLNYLVQSGYLNDQWVNSSHPVTWMRKIIRRQARLMSPKEWMSISCQNDAKFIDSELDRMYNRTIDYLDGDLMRASDAYHGHTTDCLAFAQKYEMVVVLYICDSNPGSAFTAILDGRPTSSESVIWLQGIKPDRTAPGPEILELVRYYTDMETLSLTHKSGKTRKEAKLVYRVEKGPGHYVFIDRNIPQVQLPPSMIQEAVLTRGQEAKISTASGNDGDQPQQDNTADGGAPPPEATRNQGNAGTGGGPPPGGSSDDDSNNSRRHLPASPPPSENTPSDSEATEEEGEKESTKKKQSPKKQSAKKTTSPKKQRPKKPSPTKPSPKKQNPKKPSPKKSSSKKASSKPSPKKSRTIKDSSSEDDSSSETTQGV